MHRGTVRAHAPAKLNLALHVVGRRADGYHLLESLVAFTELGDTILAEASERDAIAVEGPFARRIDGPNLIETARDALRERVGGGPVRLTLRKRLPVASGIGGGSADAAATLWALAELWGVDHHVLDDIAPTLGADVPMCLASETVIARGTGGRLTPHALPALADLHVLLVNPGIAVSTPSVFAALQSRENLALPPMPGDASAGALLDWLGLTRNDLQAPARALAPAIDNALAVLRDADFARMSGSGATCFGLYRSVERATEAADRIRGAHPDWFVARTRFLTEGTP